MLTSLEIRNFRAFPFLAVPRLGRVNLVVGKNNVGKTSLLEALRLYDARGAVQVIEAILVSRNEVRIDPEHERALPMLDTLFHKPPDGAFRPQLSIGPHEAAQEGEDWLFIEGHDVAIARGGCPPFSGGEALSGGSLSITFGEQVTNVMCEDLLASRRAMRSPFEELPFLAAVTVSEDVVGRWWDAIVLTELKDDVIKTVQCMDPSVQDISFVAHPLDPYRRMAMARTRRMTGPVPLRSLGEGVVRVFSLAAALQHRGILSEPGQLGRALLVDEVENGIHHSFHASLWSSLFHLARLNDLQIFATTHSLDCLVGFAEAVAQDEENDGLVVRLEKIEGQEQIGAVIIGRDDLPIVVRESIEVR